MKSYIYDLINKPELSKFMKTFTIIILCIFIVSIGVSFSLGLLIGQKNAPKEDVIVSKVFGQTFYATIKDIKQYSNGSIHINVKGLEINDINYRGNFTFEINDNINITWRGEDIKISDLKVGNNISITFTDEIINTISPAPLKEIVKIQLLDDKK